METKANYAAIGLLTLTAVLGAFGFVYWFQHSGGVGERIAYRVVFEGSAQGLQTGGTVLFNGIRVGEVTLLNLNPDNPRQVVAMINVAAATPVRTDTRASLHSQGITGISALSLKGGASNSPPLAPPSGDTVSTIAVDAEANQDVLEAARELIRKVDVVVTENRDSLHATIKNIDAFTSTLARNSDRFDRILAGIDNLTGGPNGESGIAEAVRAMQDLAQKLDKRTADLTADSHRVISTVERVVKNFDRNPQRLIFGDKK